MPDAPIGPAATVAPDVVARVLGDGAVLVNVATNHVYELNDTGAVMWEHISRGASEDTIVSALVTAFEVDAPTARQALSRLIAELEGLGILVR